MPYSVTTVDVTAGNRAGTAFRLNGEICRAEIWPSHGMNCLRWQVQDSFSKWEDLLFTMPDWEQNPVPTRSGHPVLFPFPNRLRHGRFEHRGQMYQLPLNDSTGQHAIHGFTPRLPWRVIDSGHTADSAYLTGEFQLSKDAPQAIPCWPADARIRLTYRLSNHVLRVEAEVDAADGNELPFGLGYHPYFRAPGGSQSMADWVLTAPANKMWKLEENLPTCEKIPVSSPFDYRKTTAIGSTILDTAYTALDRVPIANTDLLELARLQSPNAKARLLVIADQSFRELLLFTPQHRQAIAIEPYTCATDAANRYGTEKQAAGWIVLPAGGRWSGVVEYRYEHIS